MTTPTVIVAGLGRCGSTMTMHMLRAGGIPFVTGADPHSGEGGSAQPGHCFKVLNQLPSGDYGPATVAIWVSRNPRWQAASMRKFMRAAGYHTSTRMEKALRDSIIADQPTHIQAWREAMPTLVIAYEDVLRDPLQAAKSMAAHVKPLRLDAEQAARVVHLRNARTLPDLSFEMGAAR